MVQPTSNPPAAAPPASDGSSDEKNNEKKLINGPLGFLGTGNMAEALIKGLLRAGSIKDGAAAIWGSDPRASRCEAMRQRYGISMTTHNIDVMRRANLVVLSVKP